MILKSNPYLNPKAIRLALSGIKHRNEKIYYSETGEDAILNQFVVNQKGTYLDLGAGHPIIGSNTYGLYRKDWQGICVDPQTSLKLSYSLLRPKDNFIDAPVVGTKQKKIIIYRFENSLLTTINKDVANYHQTQGRKYSKDVLKCINVQDLLPRKIDSVENYVLSVDIEGAEISILNAINFKSQRPKFILVETWQYPWNTRNKITTLMKLNQYQLIAYSGLSAIFSPSETIKELFGRRKLLAKIIS